MDERRERDPDTGEHIYVGTGISDIFGKIAAKITGKTAKKIATKAAEKGMEKIGEKTGQLIGEKIYDKFKTKPKPPPPPKPEVGGKEIMEMLQEPPKTDKFQYIKSVYNDLL